MTYQQPHEDRSYLGEYANHRPGFQPWVRTELDFFGWKSLHWRPYKMLPRQAKADFPEKKILDAIFAEHIWDDLEFIKLVYSIEIVYNLALVSKDERRLDSAEKLFDVMKSLFEEVFLDDYRPTAKHYTEHRFGGLPAYAASLDSSGMSAAEFVLALFNAHPPHPRYNCAY